MTWALIFLLAAYSTWQHFRLRRLAQDMRRMSQVHHDAANRAMRRHRRDLWRARETVMALEIIARWTETPLDVPDLVNGPPDDPDSG